MRFTRLAVAALGVCAALAGCGRGDDAQGDVHGDADGGGEVRLLSGPAPGAPAPSAAAVRGQLKPGLWRISQTADGQTTVSRLCVDAALQARLSVLGSHQAAGACQETAITPAPGGGFTTRAVCDSSASGGGRVLTEGVVTGDLETAYVHRMTSAASGFAVAHMNRKSEAVAEGRYEGACPADMKPGDIDMPGGLRLNMERMADGAARAAR